MWKRSSAGDETSPPTKFEEEVKVGEKHSPAESENKKGNALVAQVYDQST